MKDYLIKLEEISHIYNTGQIEVKALNGINLTIKKGEFIAIMGPSGSGKSTLMHIIGCLHRPTSGHYILEGTNIETLKDSHLARIRNQKIGFVFQSFNLLPRFTAIKNVALPLIYRGYKKSKRLELAKKALKSVGLEDRVYHRPNELSGGQQQRVAIARALVTNPSILLADEPTGNLDSRAAKEIMRIFADLNNKGITIILVTHEEENSRYAHRIIRLKDGTIVADVNIC